MPVEMVPLAILGVGILGFAYCISMAKDVFRKLTEHQYKNHHQIWISDGRPPAEFASRKEIGFWNLSSTQAGASLFWRWYRETPEWAIGDIKAVTLLARFRRWATAAIGAWALTAMSFILLAFQMGVFGTG